MFSTFATIPLEERVALQVLYRSTACESLTKAIADKNCTYLVILINKTGSLHFSIKLVNEVIGFIWTIEYFFQVFILNLKCFQFFESTIDQDWVFNFPGICLIMMTGCGRWMVDIFTKYHTEELISSWNFDVLHWKRIPQRDAAIRQNG